MTWAEMPREQREQRWQQWTEANKGSWLEQVIAVMRERGCGYSSAMEIVRLREGKDKA